MVHIYPVRFLWTRWFGGFCDLKRGCQENGWEHGSSS
jgi:hypothetical protein